MSSTDFESKITGIDSVGRSILDNESDTLHGLSQHRSLLASLQETLLFEKKYKLEIVVLAFSFSLLLFLSFLTLRTASIKWGGMDPPTVSSTNSRAGV